MEPNDSFKMPTLKDNPPHILPNDTILVGFDFTHGEDQKILIVGHKEGKYLKIINAFEGDEAYELYKKLVTPKNEV